MALLAAQQINITGLKPDVRRPASASDTMRPDDRTFLIYLNTDAATRTISLVTPPTLNKFGQSLPDVKWSSPRRCRPDERSYRSSRRFHRPVDRARHRHPVRHRERHRRFLPHLGAHMRLYNPKNGAQFDTETDDEAHGAVYLDRLAAGPDPEPRSPGSSPNQ